MHTRSTLTDAETGVLRNQATEETQESRVQIMTWNHCKNSALGPILPGPTCGPSSACWVPGPARGFLSLGRSGREAFCGPTVGAVTSTPLNR